MRRSMRVMFFGDFGTNDRTRLTATGTLSSSRDWLDPTRTGFSATVDKRFCNSCGSVSTQVPAPTATATATNSTIIGNKMTSSISVLDAHQSRDGHGSDDLQYGGGQHQLNAPRILPERAHEARRHGEEKCGEHRRHQRHDP